MVNRFPLVYLVWIGEFSDAFESYNQAAIESNLSGCLTLGNALDFTFDMNTQGTVYENPNDTVLFDVDVCNSTPYQFYWANIYPILLWAIPMMGALIAFDIVRSG
jgi:hypothetical protein